jgi:hypothetical protein
MFKSEKDQVRIAELHIRYLEDIKAAWLEREDEFLDAQMHGGIHYTPDTVDDESSDDEFLRIRTRASSWRC